MSISDSTPVGEANPPSQSAIAPSRRNLFRLWAIRSILLVALAVAIACLYFGGRGALPWRALLGVLLFMALLNGVLLWRLKRPRAVTEREFFANLLLDVGFLTAVLYLSGGSTNPLVSYYLIPLIVSAAVLRARHTWAIAGLTLVCYSLLFFFYVPLDLFEAAGGHAGHGATTGAHFLGMWANFAFSAALIGFFVVRMAQTVRDQQQAINRVREEALRNEQIIGVASVAAGTAHELRTPLATMNLLAEELAAEHPQLAGEMRELRDQVDRCDAILGKLLTLTADSGRRRRVSVETAVCSLRERWSLTRPEVPLELQVDRDLSGGELEVDPSFDHALLNFLNNAADASPQGIGLAARREGSDLLLQIDDRGPGIPPDIAESLGRRSVSRRQGGLGLGVLLSSASIERLGGEVELLERRGGGTRLRVRLPLAG